MVYRLGFEESFAYPLAKGAGFALDLDLALLLLPTLKSLQTALRGKGGRAREWIPLDDPISFHIAVATLIAINSIIHVGSHVIHINHIAGSPVLQRPGCSVGPCGKLSAACCGEKSFTAALVGTNEF
ncbi:RBOHG [Symbiodinium natans]|uniref:RBOHG protein n=1 Tax=Symbiodinium natans TaxID=878477 RepID=A0A812IJW5_9DINO|nr:RBOHG [Symbiodinium natans]